jgi:hypothetical protein
MDLVRHIVENVADTYRHEMTENFVFPSPSKEELAVIAPLFKNEGITPEAAYLVAINFDRDPKDLSTLELEDRVKVLKLIYKLLDTKEFNESILKNLNTSDDLKNAEGLTKVSKRIIKLLIMETTNAHLPIDEVQKTPVEKMNENKMDRMRSYTSYTFILILSFIIIFLCFMINSKK